MDSTVDWSNLPAELWPVIGNRVKLRIETLQFRSVCSSWRYCLPPFDPPTPPHFPLFDSDGLPSSFLYQNTLYLLRIPSTSSPPSSGGGWLVKVEECNRMLLRNPITSRRIRYSNDSSSNSECSSPLEFRTVELGKSYFLRYISGCGSVCGLKKVVVLPPGNQQILVISQRGNLGSARSGDLKVTRFCDGGLVFDDVIVYKGQGYVVDSLGCVFRIDLSSSSSSSQVMVEVSSSLVGLLGGRKHLVEFCGELYLVDRYFDEEPNKQEDELDYSNWTLFRRGRNRRFHSGERKVVDFKVYKKMEELDGELGRWVEVKSLGDQVFFLAIDCCFSVSSKELAGCEGNCIYFSDENDVNLALRGVTRPESCVFDLEDHSIRKLGSGPSDGSQIFWPPPIELGKVSSHSMDRC